MVFMNRYEQPTDPNQDPINALETLLEKHPDVSVVCDRVGSLYVYSATQGSNATRCHFVDPIYNEQGALSGIHTSIWDEPRPNAQAPLSHMKVEIREGLVSRDTHKLSSDINPDDALAVVRAGIEIFCAYTAVPPTEQFRYYSRAYDHRHPGEADAFSMNFSLTDHEPEDVPPTWRTVGDLLAQGDIPS